jgi:hypothetical protein
MKVYGLRGIMSGGIKIEFKIYVLDRPYYPNFLNTTAYYVY